jgi:UDP-2,3-diacylglucosamine hydrolase
MEDRRVHPIYFLSDVHLGVASASKEAEKERKLLDFLDHVQGTKGELYLVGDIFDFWFEGNRRAPISFQRYRSVVKALGDLVRRGCPITYVAGNHDWWLGSFFPKRLDIKISKKAMITRLQGKKVLITHGDEVAGSDLGYRALRLVLRNRLNIGLFSLLPAEISTALGLTASRLSRHKSNRKDLRIESTLLPFARQSFLEGFDAVVCGHVHYPYITREDGHTFILLGDWMEHFSYGRMDNGTLSLEFWRAD